MIVKRTPDVKGGGDFEATLDICKAETLADGTRVIRGVATGVAEDRDGERVSKAGIEDMARQAVRGMKLTSSHEQDWMTEIGDVVKTEHDPINDELLVETHLPPKGDDPLADKAWNRMTKQGEQLAFSIGGKLEKSFYELSEVGKRRHVLDRVRLRHFMLTKKPAYSDSFAEAVAKTYTGKEPDDDAFTLEHDPAETVPVEKTVFVRDVDVEKDASSDGQDSTQERNAGTKTDKTPSRDVKQEEQEEERKDAEDLPRARHLACPNCGHEFAAELPTDMEAEPTKPGDDNDDPDARKTASQEDTVDDTLKELRTLVTSDPGEEKKVEKTDPDPPEVEKTETDPTGEFSTDDVAKMLSASHRANSEAIAEIREASEKGFDLVAKAIKDLGELVTGGPTGRKSVARSGAPTGTPSRHEVEKTATEPEEGEATIEKQIEEAPDLQAALKLVNKTAYGIDEDTRLVA